MDRPTVVGAPAYTGEPCKCQLCGEKNAEYIDQRESETKPNGLKVCKDCAWMNDKAFAHKKAQMEKAKHKANGGV